jgi:hypothetical protein
MNEEDRASIDDLADTVTRLAGEVAVLGDTVGKLTAALEKAVRVAVARG